MKAETKTKHLVSRVHMVRNTLRQELIQQNTAHMKISAIKFRRQHVEWIVSHDDLEWIALLFHEIQSLMSIFIS